MSGDDWRIRERVVLDGATCTARRAKPLARGGRILRGGRMTVGVRPSTPLVDVQDEFLGPTYASFATQSG